jgi:hypothetical protein
MNLLKGRSEDGDLGEAQLIHSYVFSNRTDAFCLVLKAHALRYGLFLSHKN